ncbi:hypothetical protein NLA06_10415 [Desulfomicrobium sp. ZS1]|uniref:hypothetical protein n=1 Tax=Desulfomicrobium sp. ZS1 TaxID=2952228 RepID=UPI0020B2C6CB|nr:hypothetical protein [Desulfomicrobium sp. ZS1]UTF48990.1 hypothetical protein NLA06_10415 [Desulfomicrobium sp. ZS1]
MQLNSVEGGDSDTPLRLIKNQPVLSDQTFSHLRSPASGKKNGHWLKKRIAVLILQRGNSDQQKAVGENSCSAEE